MLVSDLEQWSTRPAFITFRCYHELHEMELVFFLVLGNIDRLKPSACSCSDGDGVLASTDDALVSLPQESYKIIWNITLKYGYSC